MSNVKRSLVTIISGSFLLLVCLIVEPQTSARGREASQESPATPPSAVDEIPPAVGAVIKRSQNRFALTGFVKLALRRRAAAGGAIAPNAVGAALIADVVKNMQPSDVEDAVIKYARELSGAVPPEDIDLAIPRQNALAQKTINDARAQRPVVGAAQMTNVLTNEVLSPTLPRFDWRDAGWVARDSGIISLAKDQTLGGTINCGCCWAFATIGTFEGADALVNRRLINASEQNLLDCAGQLLGATPSVPYTCVGGWWAFDYLIKKGVATENSYPYTAVQSGCNDSIDRSYQALTWKYVLNQSDVPTTDAQINQIKAALCQYGPIGAAVYATAPIFGGYGPTSPPIRDFDSGNKVVGSDGIARIVDHVVVIVGWNDAKKAWAIKNSWPSWGTNDFGYIEYTANNIGFGAASVVPVTAAAGPLASAAPAAPAVGAAPRTLRTIALPRLFAPQEPSVGAPPPPGPAPTELSPAAPPKPAAPPPPAGRSEPR
jgi:C1A family cysteine protease